MRFKLVIIFFIVVLSLLLCLLSLRADVVHLKNGQKVEGKIVDETEHEVRLRFAKGVFLHLKKEDIEKIERIETDEDIYERKKKALAKEDYEGHYGLAQWCLQHDLRDYAFIHLRITSGSNQPILAKKIIIEFIKLGAINEGMKICQKMQSQERNGEFFASLDQLLNLYLQIQENSSRCNNLFAELSQELKRSKRLLKDPYEVIEYYEVCPVCGGEGKVQLVRGWPWQNCPECKGKNRRVSRHSRVFWEQLTHVKVQKKVKRDDVPSKSYVEALEQRVPELWSQSDAAKKVEKQAREFIIAFINGSSLDETRRRMEQKQRESQDILSKALAAAPRLRERYESTRSRSFKSEEDREDEEEFEVIPKRGSERWRRN